MNLLVYAMKHNTINIYKLEIDTCDYAILICLDQDHDGIKI